VLDASEYETPATKTAAAALVKWGAKGPTLLVVDAEETGALKSFRNITGVDVMAASAVGVADVIGHASMIVTEKALETLEARAADVTRGKGSGDDGGES
jgi:ribosomal protein L4